MTHTSTEQPEALRLAGILDAFDKAHGQSGVATEAAAELRRLHARVQELEARQKRKPLTVDEVKRIYYRYGGDMVNCTRAIERRHGITQGKQG